jgi:uncharacterized protein (TIGR00725 family)
MTPRRAIAVIGNGNASAELRDVAFATGRAIARHGATLICGGRGGVMEAAAAGAQSAGGHTVGILSGYDHSDANPHIEFVIATGMGQARNAIVVASAQAVVALEGEAGTLSEIGFALKLKRPVVALRSWHQLSGLARADDPEFAVELALSLAAAAK